MLKMFILTCCGGSFRTELEIDASPEVCIRYVSPGPNGIREKFQKKSAIKVTNLINCNITF